MLENNDVVHITLCYDCHLDGNVFNIPLLFELQEQFFNWRAASGPDPSPYYHQSITQ